MYHKTESCAEPPSSNTGVNQTDKPFQPIELGIDWITGSFPTTAIAQARQLLEKTFGEKFPEKFSGSIWYEKVYQLLKGVQLSIGARANGKDKGCISITSKAISILSPKKQRRLMLKLIDLGFSCTRIDTKLDDFTKTITPKLVEEAVEAGNQTGFHRDVWTTWFSSGKAGSAKAKTFQVGKRGSYGSGAFVRCYDKWLESLLSENPIDSIRLEVEFSEQKSKQVFEMLAALDVGDWTELMLNLITGTIDFIDRIKYDEKGGYTRLSPSRCKRLDWWEKVVGDVTKIKLSTIRNVTTIAKSFKWIRKQVAPTLAMLFDYLTYTSKEENPSDDVYAFFFELWFDGGERFSDSHKALLAPFIT